MPSRPQFFHCAGFLTIAVATVAVVHRLIKPLPINGFFFDGHWLLFAAGMLAYYGIHRSTARGAKFANASLLAACALAVCWKLTPILLVPIGRVIAGPEGYYVGFFFAFLISFLHRWDLAIANSVVLQPVTWRRVSCYSLYLVHWPVVKATTHMFYEAGIKGAWQTLLISMPISLSAAVIAGRLFHVLVEKRFLNTPAILP
jgi:peptidoglycan/LPS O-acetylase OafA/YrhL